ncbi:MAG: Transglycosylase domain protein [Actinomycetia bacterium]|nr:Transglycosylase domain protein [Actinomycetes bacterium]
MRRSAMLVMLSSALAMSTASSCSSAAPSGKTAVADAPHATASVTPTPRSIVIMVDGKRLETMTTGATVRDVLAQAGLRLGPHDRVTPGLDAAPVDRITVLRLLSEPVTKVLKIPAPTVEKNDKKQAAWSRTVARPGKPGLKRVLIADVLRKGKKVKAAIVQQTVIRKPVPQLIAVGPKPGSVGGAAARLNWAGLAACESHGNPKAVNAAGYYGLYQFSLSSWGTVGGSGKPTDATAAEQTYRAQLLYNRVQGRWHGQWPVCGKNLFG